MIIASITHFNSPPQKIISLVPSQTELLAWLGLEKEVIGITKFCIHPDDWHQTKTRIGGTKNLNIDLIKKLKPELIIANKEENTKAQVENLSIDFDVWVTDVNNFEDALLMINDVGELTHKTAEAQSLIENVRGEFSKLTYSGNPIPAIYFIWEKPYMSVGGDTFINDMMKCCGLQNIYEDQKRYPEITFEDIQESNCEVLLLSSEPYPFQEKHVNELQQHFPGKKILLVDGEMFSWYGSRLLQSPVYFKSISKLLG